MSLAKLLSCVSVMAHGKSYLRTIPMGHFLVENGNIYGISYLWAALGIGADAELYMADVFLGDFHFSLEIAVGGNCTIYILENPPITDAGTQLVAYNRRRTADAIDYANSLVYRDPTVGVGGVVIHEGFIPGGAGFLRLGGDVTFDNGWIWDNSANHVVRVTNGSGGAIPVAIRMTGHAAGG